MSLFLMVTYRMQALSHSEDKVHMIVFAGTPRANTYHAPGAVMFTSDGPLRGVDAIRPLFQAMIAEFGKPGAAFSMKQQSVEGDYAYILWTAETADNVYGVATDTFVVPDGKIVAQSYTGKITPKG